MRSCLLRVRFLPATLLALPVSATAQPAGPRDSLTPAFAARIDSVFTRFRAPTSPGCALAVVRAGHMVFSRGYGAAALEYGAPITPTTPFYIGSVSKQFTAASVLLLAREGRLSLDDEVRRHIPELPDYGRGRGTALTVRHLLSHTSGLREYEALREVAGTSLEDPYTLESLLPLITRQTELEFEPGSEYYYTNTAYVLLGVIASRVAGRPLREYAAAALFAPLGMTASRFREDHGVVIPGRALGYSPRPGGGYRLTGPQHDVAGAGGVVSTVVDLARWLAAFDRPEGAPLRLTDLLGAGTLSDGSPVPYGNGLFKARMGTRAVIQHFGSYLGYEAFVVRSIPDRLGVAVLCNLEGSAPYLLAQGTMRVLLGDDVPATPAYRPASLPVHATAPVPEAAARTLPGRYFNPGAGLPWEIARDSAGRLTIRGPLYPAAPLLAITDSMPGRLFGTADGTVRVRLDAAPVGGPIGTVQVLLAFQPAVVPARLTRVDVGAMTTASAVRIGSYASEEAGVRVRIVGRDDRLMLVDAGGRQHVLRPAFAFAGRDAYETEHGWLLYFDPPLAGVPAGFDLATPSLRRLRFTRTDRPAPAPPAPVRR